MDRSTASTGSSGYHFVSVAVDGSVQAEQHGADEARIASTARAVLVKERVSAECDLLIARRGAGAASANPAVVRELRRRVSELESELELYRESEAIARAEVDRTAAVPASGGAELSGRASDAPLRDDPSIAGIVAGADAADARAAAICERELGALEHCVAGLEDTRDMLLTALEQQEAEFVLLQGMLTVIGGDGPN